MVSQNVDILHILTDATEIGVCRPNLQTPISVASVVQNGIQNGNEMDKCNKRQAKNSQDEASLLADQAKKSQGGASTLLRAIQLVIGDQQTRSSQSNDPDLMSAS